MRNTSPKQARKAARRDACRSAGAKTRPEQGAIRYGSSYGPGRQLDSLLGFLTWYLCMKVMVAIPRMVEDEATMGTLENVILAPVSLPTTVVLRTVVYCLRYGLEALLLGAMLSLMLGLFVPLSVGGAVIILLTLTGTCGMGLALAGLALVYKSVGSIVGVIGNLALLFSGALVPLDGLGELFLMLKYGFPMTWGIMVLRRLAISDAVLLSSEVMGLAIQAVVMPCSGAVFGQRETQPRCGQASRRAAYLAKHNPRILAQARPLRPFPHLLAANFTNLCEGYGRL